MHISFVLILLLLSFSVAGQSPTARVKEPESDGSYEHFMDSLISRKDVIFSKKTIDAREDYYFDKVWGPKQRMPPAILIDGVRFLRGTTQIVNEKGNRLKEVTIDVDTAMLFTYHGKKYGYLRASYHNCNGTGCMESYHYIADFKTRKLYVFDMDAVPYIGTPYFGDVNKDGQLDFVVPHYVSVAGYLPYSDTTEEIELIPYTLNKSGRFETLKGYDKTDNFLIGKFDGGNFAPRNFTIIADKWEH
jgi:hypothetical protein